MNYISILKTEGEKSKPRNSNNNLQANSGVLQSIQNGNPFKLVKNLAEEIKAEDKRLNTYTLRLETR